MIKLFLLTIFQAMILSYAVAQNQELTCTSINGRIGKCIIIRQCSELLNILQTRPLKSETIDLLRQLQCGFNGNNPKVCCPIQNTNIDTTYRDNNENDIKSNQNSKEQNEQNTDKSIDDENLHYDFSNNSLIPTDCGSDLSQRIIGGEITELDEFPWMVLLEHAKPNGKVTICGGVLISRRYVLTAAHCIKGKDLPITWRLESVRLGEYNTDTNPDCVQDDENTLICADEPISVGVEEQMAHENYRPRSRNQKYDIALLRLSRDVTFTNYIKPICLPSTASLGQKLFVAGWGKTENGSSSNVKLKVSLPFVDKQQCQSTYDNVQVSLGYGQICVGGQKGKDSCRGDSGGPLMTVERERNGNGRWTVAGVVSFGPLPCEDRCTTPQKKIGVCIDIRDCQPLVKILKQRPVSVESVNYLISFHCGFNGNYSKVCCETQNPVKDESNSSAISEPPDVTNHPNLSLLNHDICGPITEQKIFGGNTTGIFDYPWMALLFYDTGNLIPEFRCGGSLINKRYVLTAAHCVTSLPSELRLVGVRLGEHNFRTERDCEKEADELEVVCAEKYQDFSIEKTHFHPKFSRGKLQNDIALVRLNNDADFRPQNVRPICMPIGSAAILSQKKVTVTGWGTTELGLRSQELLQVHLSLVNIEKCAQVYKERKTQIWYKQICAGGKNGMDSCSGDSGGPLQAPGMYNNNLKYIQYGLVSFGPTKCGLEGVPAVYTNLVYYMDWILNTISA